MVHLQLAALGCWTWLCPGAYSSLDLQYPSPNDKATYNTHTHTCQYVHMHAHTHQYVDVHAQDTMLAMHTYTLTLAPRVSNSIVLMRLIVVTFSQRSLLRVSVFSVVFMGIHERVAYLARMKFSRISFSTSVGSRSTLQCFSQKRLELSFPISTISYTQGEKGSTQG